MAFSVIKQDSAWELIYNGLCLLRQGEGESILSLGEAEADISMFRGNFTIEDHVSRRIGLRLSGAEGDTLTFTHPELRGGLTVTLREEGGLLRLHTHTEDPRWNRLWLRLEAEEKEHVTGGGEQFSALDLRGRTFPIWTREQGVGRNKETEITRLADELDGSGGDYHTTFFPQPTFVSSRLRVFSLTGM